ncbi:MAG: gamma carbonic anhydrase family protein [Desulfobacterales bacterium]|jgi:carbonic anhydrase/acetyltransferase-like protein (isoleucine patch superfamily)|nr:gamma carbonic anhydrase family protein [Desulfobacterales bacterium]
MHPNDSKALVPRIHPSVFIAEGARIYGDVEIKKGASVWFNAVIRGDEGSVTIGENTNIQDNVVVHSDAGAIVVIGDSVTVGHSAVVRGARIGDHVSIGMNATIMSYAELGDYSVVGANTFVGYHKKFPEKSLITGVPGKLIRQLEGDMLNTSQIAVDIYMDLVKQYTSGRILGHDAIGKFHLERPYRNGIK